MTKQSAFGTAIVFTVAMITILLNRFILSSTTAVAQEQQINSNTTSQGTTSSSSSIPCLSTLYSDKENSVVQIISKTPTTSNSSNQLSSNVNTLGSGFVY